MQTSHVLSQTLRTMMSTALNQAIQLCQRSTYWYQRGRSQALWWGDPAPPHTHQKGKKNCFE